MTKEELLNKAMLIAQESHKKQVDKNGQPYIGHVFRVMNMGKTLDEKICGVLHDIVEDTEWTFEKLETEGFPEHIINALKYLTKNESETYEEFINRVITNNIAVNVKINDLTDNLDVKRYKELNEKDIERIKKYLRWYHFLTSENYF